MSLHALVVLSLILKVLGQLVDQVQSLLGSVIGITPKRAEGSCNRGSEVETWIPTQSALVRNDALGFCVSRKNEGLGWGASRVALVDVPNFTDPEGWRVLGIGEV